MYKKIKLLLHILYDTYYFIYKIILKYILTIIKQYILLIVRFIFN